MLGKIDRNKKINLLVMATLCGLALFLSFLSFFQNADLYISDLLYQKGNLSLGQIVIIEIDEKSLEAYGSNPLAWDRIVFSDLLNKLYGSKGNGPAVVGLDVIFAHKEKEESDALLAQAAEKGNVVTAGMYYYGNLLETNADGSYYWKKNGVIDEAMAYDELYNHSLTGIVNLNLDKDGIVRHFLLSYPGKVNKEASFAYQVAKLYCEEKGRELVLPKENAVYLDYTYPSGGYREKISLVDVLNDQYPLSYFEGKIVLIGACASSMQDEYLTAISRNKAMYGVEVHANCIELLLRGEYKKEVSSLLQRLILLAVLFVNVWINTFKGLKETILSGLLFSFGWLMICLLSYRFTYVLHPLWIPVGVSLLFIASVASHYFREAAARRKIRKQFERYVDPSVLKKILDNGEKELGLEGKECEIAVLFVDICGFTSLSEKLDSKKVVQILNRYLDMVSACILNNGGTLDKFIGDCAMAFWNAPFEQEDPIDLCLKAACEMLEQGQKLNEDLGFDLGFAIGIHAGKAIVGNIGSMKRMDFTAIGDTVNTASRLESLKIEGIKREGNIYISEEVYEMIKGRYEVQDLGEHKLKGKEKAIHIYAVQGQ